MDSPSSGDSAPSAPSPSSSHAVLVREPSEGTPPLVDTPEAIARTVRRLAAGTGAFAVDSERAAGFRYSQRAYVVQIRRTGSGTHLIDPLPVENHLGGLRELLAEDEWILHAASQDLPCLRELGFEPPSIFDTELAGRLLGRRHVALGTMVEEVFDVMLAKEHSAADWSTRPIPVSGLNYAALDVEFLIPLRDRLATELALAGKSEWAMQEFEHVLRTPETPPRPDPWRRTRAIGDVKTQRGLAVVRELWLTRDQLARKKDIAPGRLVNDRAIIAVASRNPLPESLPSTRDWRRVDPQAWAAAYSKALNLPRAELPPRRGPSRGGLPETRVWRRVNPPAAARLDALRTAVLERAETLNLPQENLLTPATQRRIAWESTLPNVDQVRSIAEADNARPWQIENTASSIADALLQIAKQSIGR
ncbi:MAG TPA: HRDC domain-containing protein [Actinomycetaceae bacterium]|nr:HRDC domain-containing protein [Actinomycetaceae bacterium]